MLVALFTALLAALVVFQVALALGAPWGAFAWGGSHAGRLPRRLRIASAASILVYALIAVVALDRAGVIGLLPDVVSAVGMWVIAGYLTLGVLMNAISRSRLERMTMTPVALALAVLAALIALGL